MERVCLVRKSCEWGGVIFQNNKGEEWVGKFVVTNERTMLRAKRATPGDHKGAEPPYLAAIPARRAGRQLVPIQRTESQQFVNPKAPRSFDISTRNLREVVGLGLT